MRFMMPENLRYMFKKTKSRDLIALCAMQVVTIH